MFCSTCGRPQFNSGHCMIPWIHQGDFSGALVRTAGFVSPLGNNHISRYKKLRTAKEWKKLYYENKSKRFTTKYQK